MDLINTIDKIRKEGMVHFWNLPDKIYLILQTDFKNDLIKEFMTVARTKYNAKKLTGIQRQTISKIIKGDYPIRIAYLLKIINVINNGRYKLNCLEENIKWIGDFRSEGITNPKLPFNFNSREGARFLAGICNEGWISDGMYYSNSKDESRESVKNDALKIFGGNNQTIGNFIKEKDQYLAFPSIMRDVVIVLTDFKGVKAERNPKMPHFIFRDKELMYGWLEQTIGDEGHVKFHPHLYRREIIWRRACDIRFDKCNLIENELILLQNLGINYDLKNIGTYVTSKGKKRFRLQIRISRKENLSNLNNLIKIPNYKKNQLFYEMLKSC